MFLVLHQTLDSRLRGNDVIQAYAAPIGSTPRVGFSVSYRDYLLTRGKPQ